MSLFFLFFLSSPLLFFSSASSSFLFPFILCFPSFVFLFFHHSSFSFCFLFVSYWRIGNFHLHYTADSYCGKYSSMNSWVILQLQLDNFARDCKWAAFPQPG
ncbi:hypothetical protein HOY82DRAFT_552743 [Tuber indicum]|nr:hypothetical protein HOY82DRAFT_552743 [Tuber indicum]